MDTFRVKLAQRFNAQDMIKANSEAEANEMKRLKQQLAEYEQIIQEMRKLNYKNTELTEKLDLMIGENADKMHGLQENEQKLIELLHGITEEQTKNRKADLAQREEERLEKERSQDVQQEIDMEAVKQLIEGKFQESDDFVHKENVKVYRNVQAVVVEEVKNCVDTLQEDQNKLKKKVNKTICFAVIGAIASVWSLAIWVAVILLTTGVI
jgi:hypothetical protein